MIFPSVHPTVPEVDDRVLSLAKKFAVVEDSGYGNRVYSGYLLAKTKFDSGAMDFRSVRVFDLPGTLFGVDVFGYGSRGYASAQVAIGPRHPWRFSAEYALPETGQVTVPSTPTVVLGTAPLTLGNMVFETANINESSVVTAEAYNYLRPTATRGSAAQGAGCGFWRCQLETAEQLTLEDFLPFGSPESRPAHWLSVVSGYGSGTSYLDVRIAPDYVDALAPGFSLQPVSNGTEFTSSVNGPGGGTWQAASACRRVLGELDLLAVALPVADTTNITDRVDAYNTGEAGLLVLLFSVTAAGPALLRNHLFRSSELGPLFQGAIGEGASVGDGDVVVFNNAVHHAVMIADDGTVHIDGVWAGSRVQEQQIIEGEVYGPYVVPILQWYRADVGAETAELTPQWTTVLVSAAHDFDGNLALDDGGPTAPTPVPIDLVSTIDGDGLVHTIALCNNFDRTRIREASYSQSVVAEPYLDDPISLYCFTSNTFTSLATVYPDVPQFVFDDGVSLGFLVWRRAIFSKNMAVLAPGKFVVGGFSRGTDRAKRVQFVEVDGATGAVTESALPDHVTDQDLYPVPPKVTVYQERLYTDAAKSDLATGPCVVLSYVVGGATKTAYTYLYRGNGWEPVPAIAGYTGTHYLGNGFFGQRLRTFVEDGF